MPDPTDPRTSDDLTGLTEAQPAQPVTVVPVGLRAGATVGINEDGSRLPVVYLEVVLDPLEVVTMGLPERMQFALAPVVTRSIVVDLVKAAREAERMMDDTGLVSMTGFDEWCQREKIEGSEDTARALVEWLETGGQPRAGWNHGPAHGSNPRTGDTNGRAPSPDG